MRDLLHTADLIAFGALGWVAAGCGLAALGLIFIVAGSVHAYRRYSR